MYSIIQFFLLQESFNKLFIFKKVEEEEEKRKTDKVAPESTLTKFLLSCNFFLFLTD